MASSTNPEVRRQVEREAVRKYTDSLSRLRGVDMDHEHTWRQYRFGMLLALFIPVITCGAMQFPNERAERLATLGLERTLTAIEDLDSGELLESMKRSSVGGRLASSAVSSFHRATRRFVKV